MGEMNTTELNLPKATPNILMPLPDYDFDPTLSAERITYRAISPAAMFGERPISKNRRLAPEIAQY